MEVSNSVECKEILQSLYLKWGIKNDHWIPLEERKNSKEIVFYPHDYFFNNYGIDQLRKLVSSISKDKIYKWHWETRNQELYEIPIKELISYKQELLEKYYFDQTFDWVIYMSHENTITFGGKTIINQLENDWSNWEKNINQWEE